MKKFSVFIFTLIIFWGLRLAYIDADPPYISWSKGAYTDIGFYISNARNAALFNHPEAGDWDNRVLFPVFHYISYLWFLIAGVSFSSVNLLAMLVSFFTGLILMKYSDDMKYIFFAGILWSVNFIGLCESKILFQENIAIFFLTAAVLFIRTLSYSNFFCGIVCFCLALLTKTYSVFFTGVILFFVIIEWRNKSISFKEFAGYCLILLFGLAACAAYYFYAYQKFDHSILNYTIFNKQSNDFFYILSPLNTNFFARIPEISFCALLFIFFNFSLSRFSDEKYRNTDILMMLWIFFFFTQQSQFQYNPLRYYIYLLPPLVYLSVRFIIDLNIFFPVMPLSFKNKFIFFILMYFAGYNFIWALFRSVLNKHISLNSNLELALATAIIFYISFYIISALFAYFRILSSYFSTVIIVFSVFIGIFQYYHFFIKIPTYNLRDASVEIGKILDKDSVLAGWFAPQLCIQNNIKAIPTYNDTEEYFIKNKATHILLEENSERYNYGKFKLRKLKSFKIDKINVNLNLYEIGN